MQPSPFGGWSESVVTLNRAFVVPPDEGTFVQTAGVLTEDGAYCPQGALWRKYRPLTKEPNKPESAKLLTGRWLWGGVLWAHFGHFLVESTARLWALDDTFDGVLFVPKRPRVGDGTKGFQHAFVHQMQADMPIRVATEPLQVEELVVPGQGFGLGKITAGTPRFRAAIRDRFAQGIRPEGPERLYISRSALGLGKGGLLGEERLEDLLSDEGYVIFHPEKHDIPTQLARYKAAKQVIAVDGSALHLFAMVGRADQTVAMILRRKEGANNLLADNVRSFCGTDPIVINALRTEWVRADRGRSDRLSFGELDHAELGKRLQAAGFVAAGSGWTAMTEAERTAEFAAKGLQGRGTFVESPRHKQLRIRAARQERRRTRTENQT